MRLDREIELISLYIKMEHIRFEDLFEYHINIDDSVTKDGNIPPKIIQPFIENSINRGFYNLKDRKGKLNLSMWQNEKDYIFCKITDNRLGG